MTQVLFSLIQPSRLDQYLSKALGRRDHTSRIVDLLEAGNALQVEPLTGPLFVRSSVAKELEPPELGQRFRLGDHIAGGSREIDGVAEGVIGGVELAVLKKDATKVHPYNGQDPFVAELGGEVESLCIALRSRGEVASFEVKLAQIVQRRNPASDTAGLLGHSERLLPDPLRLIVLADTKREHSQRIQRLGRTIEIVQRAKLLFGYGEVTHRLLVLSQVDESPPGVQVSAGRTRLLPVGVLKSIFGEP